MRRLSKMASTVTRRRWRTQIIKWEQNRDRWQKWEHQNSSSPWATIQLLEWKQSRGKQGSCKVVNEMKFVLIKSEPNCHARCNGANKGEGENTSDIFKKGFLSDVIFFHKISNIQPFSKWSRRWIWLAVAEWRKRPQDWKSTANNDFIHLGSWNYDLRLDRGWIDLCGE